MNCLVCGSLAVGLCSNCGVALCRDHLAERKQHRVGGTTLGCLRWSRFFGQVVKVDSRAEEEAPRWPGRDGGSRRSSRHG